jgi:hypothetical protein
MPRVWFLILEHQVWLLFSPWHILFALQSRNYYCFIPIVFSCCLEKLLQVLFGDDRKRHVGRLLFWLGNSKPFSLRTGLILPHMLGLVFLPLKLVFTVFIVFHKKNKNKLGEKMQNFISLLITFQILHVFLPDISIHCALIEYDYIWLRVYDWYLLSFPVHTNAR